MQKPTALVVLALEWAMVSGKGSAEAVIIKRRLAQSLYLRCFLAFAFRLVARERLVLHKRSNPRTDVRREREQGATGIRVATAPNRRYPVRCLPRARRHGPFNETTPRHRDC